MVTYNKLFDHFTANLKDVIGERETLNCFWLTLYTIHNWTKIQFSIHRNEELSDKHWEEWAQVIQRLKMHEPLQYILGKTEFYGLEIEVNQDTLIPRPETEELVDLILSENKAHAPSVLDVGTGSGCIITSLARHMNGNFWAMDVSAGALKVASRNAESIKKDITFKLDSILDPKETYPSFDIIVSNPPYIPEKDKNRMAKNVLDYEPDLALFVSDKNPLLFYIEILRFAEGNLNPEGSLYFEIHEDYTKELKVLLELIKCDFTFYKDLQGKDRMLKIWNLND